MLEQMTGLPPGIVGVSLRGRVEAEDYDAIEALFDDARERGERVRLLYHVGPDFESFTARGAFEDARVGMRYLRQVERCAIASDHGWIRAAGRLLRPFMPYPLRVYGDEEQDQALDWLAEPTEATSIAPRILEEQGVLLLEVNEPIGAEDVDAVAEVVDPWIERVGMLRGLVLRSRDMPTWQDPGSLLRHIQFVRDHHHHIRRVAVCSDSRVVHTAEQLLDRLVDADLEHFPFDRVDEAITWAQAT